MLVSLKCPGNNELMPEYPSRTVQREPCKSLEEPEPESNRIILTLPLSGLRVIP